MSGAVEELLLKKGLHRLPREVFGSPRDLIRPGETRERDTLLIACSELGAAPDNISCATPERFVVLQHLAASMPSLAECERFEGVSMLDVQRLFEDCEFCNVIVCGHLGCNVIRNWLNPRAKTQRDAGSFRARFESRTVKLVDSNYDPETTDDRVQLMICEHVLCQLENLLTHRFVDERVRSGWTRLHGWVIDDDSARVMAYCPRNSTFTRT
ncbi:MAG: carbonic anhydrase [Planctomycetota bacterium]